MEKATIIKLNKSFEESADEQDGVEYWLARELQALLGYADWRNFLNAIDKAKESCKNTSEAVSDHFVDVTKTILTPKNQQKRSTRLAHPAGNFGRDGCTGRESAMLMESLNLVIG